MWGFFLGFSQYVIFQVVSCTYINSELSRARENADHLLVANGKGQHVTVVLKRQTYKSISLKIEHQTPTITAPNSMAIFICIQTSERLKASKSTLPVHMGYKPQTRPSSLRKLLLNFLTYQGFGFANSKVCPQLSPQQKITTKNFYVKDTTLVTGAATTLFVCRCLLLSVGF